MPRDIYRNAPYDSVYDLTFRQPGAARPWWKWALAAVGVLLLAAAFALELYALTLPAR